MATLPVSSAQEIDPVSQALTAWVEGRAYWDGRNYRLQPPSGSRSRMFRRVIAPWSKAVKTLGYTPAELHMRAEQYKAEQARRAELLKIGREKRDKRINLAIRILESVIAEEPADVGAQVTTEDVRVAAGFLRGDPPEMPDVLRLYHCYAEDVLEAAVDALDAEAANMLKQGNYPAMNRAARNAELIDNVRKQLL